MDSSKKQKKSKKEKLCWILSPKTEMLEGMIGFRMDGPHPRTRKSPLRAGFHKMGTGPALLMGGAMEPV